MILSSLEKKLANIEYRDEFIHGNGLGGIGKYAAHLERQEIVSLEHKCALNRYLLSPDFLNLCYVLDTGDVSGIGSMNLFVLKLRSMYKELLDTNRKNNGGDSNGNSWLEDGYREAIKETYGLTLHEMIMLSGYLIKGLEACKLIEKNKIKNKREITETGKKLLMQCTNKY